VIAVPTAAPQHRPDVTVDGLDGAEGDRLVAVVEDPLEMAREQRAQLAEGGQPLPPQGLQPAGQEAPGRAGVAVAPELGQLLLEEVRLGQAPVEGEEVPEGLAIRPVEIGPTAQEQPPLAADQPAGRSPLPEELRPARLVQRLTGVAEDMELVVDDPRVGEVGPGDSGGRAPTCPRRPPTPLGAGPAAAPRRRTGPGSRACAPGRPRSARPGPGH